ncbi:MAG: PA14 domain-containing protein [Pseudomonadota bacterium]
MRKMQIVKLFLMMLALAGCQTIGDPALEDLPPTAATPSTSKIGLVYVRYYDGISGSTLDGLTSSDIFPDQPTERASIERLASLSKRGDNYGAFVRGYIIPPADGDYKFFLAADDQTQLSLSTDSSAENLVKIAHVPSWTNQETYTQYSSQKSGLIRLNAGTRYYFELLHKQGVGGDHFSVAWSGPGISQEIIDGESLASWAPSGYSESEDAEEIYSLGYRVGFFDGGKDLTFSPTYPPQDQDQDGVYDNWEVFYGMDPSDPSDASVDSDGDLLTAREEFLLGTNPTNPDTSGDGLTDGEKFAYDLDPLDPDDIYTEIDGETVNLYEYLYGEPEIIGLEFMDGFIGHYFSGNRFDSFVFTRTDDAIAFDWGGDSPDPSIPSDGFSVRWFAQVHPPHESGASSYRLNLRGDDGVRAWLNGEQVIDGWKPQSATTYSSVVELNVEQAPYELVVEYFEGYGGATVELWLTDVQTGNVIDQPGLFQRPSLELTDQTALVDSDQDGIPDVWELSYGLNPWQDDAATVHNDQELTSLQAYEMGVHPWTLAEVSEPVSPVTSTPETSEGSVTLNWTAPSTRTDGSSISLSEIDHYLIRYGQDEEALSQEIEIPADTTSRTFEGLTTGTWYFEIQVIDTSGLDSVFSDVVSISVD